MPQAPTPSSRRTFVRAALVTAVVFAAGMAVASQTGLLGASSAAPASNLGTAVAIDTVVATPATIIQYRDITIDAPAATPDAGAPAVAAEPAANAADPGVTAVATEVVYVDEVAPAGESGEGEHEGDDEGEGEHDGARSERHESHEDEGGELDD